MIEFNHKTRIIKLLFSPSPCLYSIPKSQFTRHHHQITRHHPLSSLSTMQPQIGPLGHRISPHHHHNHLDSTPSPITPINYAYSPQPPFTTPPQPPQRLNVRMFDPCHVGEFSQGCSGPVKAKIVVDFFHRFVRPTKMGQQRINQYIEGKYGKFGVDRVWHETAIPFRGVIQQFEAWISHHKLWRKELGGPLHRAAFVTCGNWDIKTKIPQQCQVSGMGIPSYFMEWINLKDVYLNFYNRKAFGMRSMLNQLNIPILGSHHLGIDDTKNITRVLQRMLADGALIQITARRNPAYPNTVQFLFKTRIR